MRFAPIQILTNGDLSADVYSEIIDLNQIFSYSIQAVWTGSSAAGTLKLQVSDDMAGYYGQSNSTSFVVNWSDYTGSSTTVSGPGNFLWNVTDVGYRWVRLAFIASGGSSGSINATYSGKGV